MRRAIPAQVQSVTVGDLENRRPLDLSEHLERNFSGVSASRGQGNPFQPEVSFRGFTASPLLGAPQGISVFIDGVHVNEAFGETP